MFQNGDIDSVVAMQILGGASSLLAPKYDAGEGTDAKGVKRPLDDVNNGVQEVDELLAQAKKSKQDSLINYFFKTIIEW